MRCARSSALATGLGPRILAAFLLVATCPAKGAEFPDVALLPARSEMPDPLVMLDGEPVTNPEQWSRRRRPELKALFQYYMYGQMPPRPDDQTFAIAREDRSFLDGKATLKEVTITIGPPEVPRIHLLLVVPNDAERARTRLPRGELPGQSRGGR